MASSVKSGCSCRRCSMLKGALPQLAVTSLVQCLKIGSDIRSTPFVLALNGSKDPSMQVSCRTERRQIIARKWRRPTSLRKLTWTGNYGRREYEKGRLIDLFDRPQYVAGISADPPLGHQRH